MVVSPVCARALAIRDHVLPLVRAHGMLQDLDGKDSPLRLLVLDASQWQFTHWTPFNAIAPGEAASPGYRTALKHQQGRPELPYGLTIRNRGTTVLTLLWGDGGCDIVSFVRGDWEEAVLTLAAANSFFPSSDLRSFIRSMLACNASMRSTTLPAGTCGASATSLPSSFASISFRTASR